MSTRARQSIGRRLSLAVVLATGLAVATAAGVLTAQQVRDGRRALVRELSGLAEIVALNSLVALTSDDPSSAETTLLALSAREHLEAAAVYDAGGKVVAQYRRDYETVAPIPEAPRSVGSRFGSGTLELVEPVERGDRRLGSVYLRASTRAYREAVIQAWQLSAAVFGLCLAPALLAAARLRRGIARPLEELTRRARTLAEGDLRETDASPTEESGKDEIGLLGAAFAEMGSSLQRLVLHIREAAQAVVGTAGTLSRAIERARHAAEVQEGAAGETASAVAEVRDALRAGVGHFEKLGESTGAGAASAAEMSRSTTSVDAQMDTLGELLDATASAATESRAAVAELSRTMGGVRQEGDEAVASLEKLEASVASITGRAESTQALSTDTSRQAQRGSAAVEQTVEGMRAIEGSFDRLQGAITDLEGRTDSIDHVTAVIEEVADETRLLSLNASIIAAQAGEWGRGFGVVASHIADLAERTRAFAVEIEGSLRGIQTHAREAAQAMGEGRGRVERGVVLSGEAAETLRAILEAAEETARQVDWIRGDAEEQSRLLEQVGTVVRAVRQGVGQVEHAVEEHEQASREVSGAMERLREVGERVRRANAEQSQQSGDMAGAMEAIDAVAKQLQGASALQLRQAERIEKALEVFHQASTMSGDEVRGLAELVQALSQRAEAFRAAVARFRLGAAR